jgi:hypothetical protein
MITVMWYCHDNTCNRVGKLLQIACDGESVSGAQAYIITDMKANDKGHHYLHGGNDKEMRIIVEVDVDRLIVKGTPIALV